MIDPFAWRHKGAADRVMRALLAVGDARFVGGCVRDSLLGLPPGPPGRTDIDIATPLLPHQVIAALKEAKIHSIPTGLEHGTITAVENHIPIEITTLRSDVKTDGRRATVVFTEDWDADASRRDFTMNAIYLSADGIIYDSVGGRDDLAAGIVRFIGDASDRIREDYLRIFRFLRFSGRFAKSLDPVGLAACGSHRAGIEALSKERVWQEVAKIFTTASAPLVIDAAQSAGILAEVVDEPPSPLVFRQIHQFTDGNVFPALGLAALWPTAIREVLQAAFKPATAILEAVSATVLAANAADAGYLVKKMLYQFGAENARNGVLLAAARAGHSRPDSVLAELARTKCPVLPFAGRDFLSRGMTAGPQVGRARRYAEQSWVDAGLPDDPAVIAKIMADAVRHAMDEGSERA